MSVEEDECSITGVKLPDICECVKTRSDRRSCLDVRVHVPNVPLLDKIVQFSLPVPWNIIPIWFRKDCTAISSFYPGNGHFAVRGCDFVFLCSFPLPGCLHQDIPFGPFLFVRYWIIKKVRFAILSDRKGDFFRVKHSDLLFYFTLESESWVCSCQRKGFNCRLCKSVFPQVLFPGSQSQLTVSQPSVLEQQGCVAGDEPLREAEGEKSIEVTADVFFEEESTFAGH